MSIDNIVRVFNGATPLQLETGLQWYRDAYGIALDIADAHNVRQDRVAGVIAALSPRMAWDANLNLAHRFIAAGGLESGYLKTGLTKAQRILDGELPVDVLTGLKTRSFYLNIRSGGGGTTVTVDRHAIDIAAGRHQSEMARASLTAKQYEAIADEYRTAAAVLNGRRPTTLSPYGNLTPAQVQAVTWVAWREEFGGVRV